MNGTSPRSAHPTSEEVLLRSGVLPFDPLELLAGRSRRLADLVESISRRKDVRDLRARLLVLLLELRCPARGRPLRRWYVPGAVARLSLEAMRRAWRGFYGLEAPCARTLRSHLGVLERCLALVRQPGEWVEQTEYHPNEWRPRYADTLHLLEDDEAMERWRLAAPALAKHPEAKTNPDAWRRHVGAWRTRERSRQLELPLAAAEAHPEGLPDRVWDAERKGRGEALARAVGAVADKPDHDALDVLRVLVAHRVTFQPRSMLELAADRPRLLGSAALLAFALVRGDAVRSAPAWLLRAHRLAKRDELERAVRWAVARHHGGGA